MYYVIQLQYTMYDATHTYCNIECYIAHTHIHTHIHTHPHTHTHTWGYKLLTRFTLKTLSV